MEPKMMSKGQGWALYCITKKDYRKENLTYEQASDLIKKLGTPDYKKNPSLKAGYNDAQRIMEEAVEAGMEALVSCTVNPMAVKGGGKMYVIDGGVCGFANVHFKATTPNRKFLAGLKKAGMVETVNPNSWCKAYEGGFQFFVHEGGQSLERKEAFAEAFVQVLRNNGIAAYVRSRMD